MEFLRTYSIEEFKAENNNAALKISKEFTSSAGNKVRVFSCGSSDGIVSPQLTADSLRAKAFAISECEDQDGRFLLLHNKRNEREVEFTF